MAFHDLRAEEGWEISPLERKPYGDMVHIPGGTFRMGSDRRGPIHHR